MVVYTLGNIATDRLAEDADFGKKNHLFRWCSFWSWRVCKQEILWHLGHKKPARILWKADAPKTSHCLVWILVQRHNWANFFFENEQGEAVTVNGDRYRAMLNEVLFTKIEKEDLATFDSNRAALRATQPTLYSMFYALFLKIALSAAELVLFGCDLTPLDIFVYDVKDKCYADKPKTILRFVEDIWHGGLNRGFRSNKPSHYLLDYLFIYI